jgi:hypothetical protein
MTPKLLRKDINFKPELDFRQGYSRRKSLGEHKAMVLSFDQFREL